MKIKDKYWKYATITLMIVGIASLFLSNATAFPYEMSVNQVTDKSKTYEMINVGTLSAYIIADLDPDEIDQVQDTLSVYYRIGVGDYGCSILQPAVNDREPMTGFQVAIGRHGTPSSALYIGIMYPNYGSPFDGQNYMIAGSLQAANVPQSDTFYWFGIDCSNYPLDISSGPPALGIVVMSTDDPDDSNYWMWGGGSGNPYPTYRPRGWNTQDNAWQNDMLPDASTIDMCFVTYTTSGGGGDIPVISITTTSWVTANIGFACLIAAAVSGCKWAALIL
jgi:hypothetical protein